jgi:hypothetical protein
MGRFETRWLTAEKNLSALVNLTAVDRPRSCPPSAQGRCPGHGFERQPNPRRTRDERVSCGSWTKPRRVVAKVEWHTGELYPRVGFAVTKWRGRSTTWSPSTTNAARASNGKGRQGRAIRWTRLSCRSFAANAGFICARLQSRQFPTNAGDARAR